jgi:hypothetical protein
VAPEHLPTFLTGADGGNERYAPGPDFSLRRVCGAPFDANAHSRYAKMTVR